MNNSYSFKIFSETEDLPSSWNTLACNTIFLSKEYLAILEQSAPTNMKCYFIGIFSKERLVGIALSQFLDLNKLESFGGRDRCVKSLVRNFIFKNLASHVLFIGNNMLTGQNAYAFSADVDYPEAIKMIKLAIEELKKTLRADGIKIHFTTYKDFFQTDIENFDIPEFNSIFKFSTQPNMIFDIQENWKSEHDYIASLSKKYRDQYKRARKKAEGIEKRKLSLKEIIQNEETIYALYHHVAENAPFNTFFLAKNHFSIFKEKLKDKFLFYGYFLNEKLIGFNTLIINGKTMDTYFLGYDDTLQREKMLYLNMLYDMIGYSIKKGFQEIVFARTALEIKSSVGAKPIKMYGLMEHSNKLINKHIAKFFAYLEPETIWQERNPFK